MKKEMLTAAHPAIKPNKNPEALRVCMNCGTQIRNRPVSSHCSQECANEYVGPKDTSWEPKWKSR